MPDNIPFTDTHLSNVDTQPRKPANKGLTVDEPQGTASQRYRMSKGIVDDLFGFFGAENYKYMPLTSAALHSPLMARLMNLRAAFLKSMDGDSVTAEARTMALFNNRFVTVNEGDARYPDGSLNCMSVFDIIRHFDPSIPEAQWPSLLLTSNHALTSDHKDIGGIMLGIKKMFEDATERSFNIEAHPDEANSMRDKTILLSSIFTEETPQENGARLIHNIHEIKRNMPLSERQKTPLIEHRLRSYFPGKSDRRENISPASIQLAKLMLALIVTEPERIHFDSPATEAELATGQALDRCGVPQDMQPTSPPLVIRADAARILSRIVPAGYSMGGNVVSQAGRWLLAELEGKDHWSENSVQGIRKVEGSFFKIQRNDGTQTRLQEPDVKHLLQNIEIASLAAGEKPLTRRELARGLRRLNLVSDQDKIAQHFNVGERYCEGDRLI
ncbi:MAG: hypothetical protein K2Q12_04430, partial [Rickettsiales bacterium]|nr:hypothetical protein [Rickettsiales bacterium]